VLKQTDAALTDQPRTASLPKKLFWAEFTVGANMKARISLVVALLGCVAAAILHASGQAGIYGVIERVVFEPNDQSPERVQIWGAFALIERMPLDYNGPNNTRLDGQNFTNYQYQPPTRGYLYFKLPPASGDIANARVGGSGVSCRCASGGRVRVLGPVSWRHQIDEDSRGRRET
jgi:hypothetical protein